MSGRHRGKPGMGPGIGALPRTLKLAGRLLPRQFNDEIRLAKLEAKEKGARLGMAGAFAGVALVFVMLLVIALVVAAILGLATIMPGWLAALVVSAAFLLIIAIGGLVAAAQFKKAQPLLPAEAIRGIKHDLGVLKEGSDFDASILDPDSEAYKAAKAAKEEAARKAKEEAAAKEEARHRDEPPAPTKDELLRRLQQRRDHLAGVRDQLGSELDLKTQGRFFQDLASEKIDDGRKLAEDLGKRLPEGLTGRLAGRWKEILAFFASAAVLAVGLRRLFRK
ncbi:phage holin family protein [Arthrobacter cupressi]|uniref:Putative Holin-X, holin superfamily III n=1 Tax=Arthrobacter cupressi TaxID=1045773 RepID=A0A1G8RR31_9MICC|nr:phage holin family protein [Arthrobacter cupressi]NYD79290.1 putative membrane protein YqjE [Arthrobacter cupressi]SDJ19369.1 Putative Holin-X, holin superfamily III [Arthrobacter cupressi]